MSLTATIDLGARFLAGGSGAPPLDFNEWLRKLPEHTETHRATERAIHHPIHHVVDCNT
jgi:hypothetical protein